MTAKKRSKSKSSAKSAKTRSKLSNSTVHFEVCLHETANPPVFISERNRPAGPGDKLKWSRSSGAKPFKFVDFGEKSEPFEDIDIKNNKIECSFKPSDGSPSGTSFPYTITVERNGTKYTSTQVFPDPTDGRPVIRKTIGP